MNKWIVVVAVAGILALIAGLHQVVVHTARGTPFANAFAGTCQWCHGGRDERFAASTANQDRLPARATVRRARPSAHAFRQMIVLVETVDFHASEIAPGDHTDDAVALQDRQMTEAEIAHLP